MPLYHFNQNNSGGSFVEDDEDGIGPHVYIEAPNADKANLRARRLGIYFNGVEGGSDCSCCGDRWYETSESDSLNSVTQIHESLGEYMFSWHHTVYVHKLDGTILRLKEDSLTVYE